MRALGPFVLFSLRGEELRLAVALTGCRLTHYLTTLLEAYSLNEPKRSSNLPTKGVKKSHMLTNWVFIVPTSQLLEHHLDAVFICIPVRDWDFDIVVLI